MLFNSAEFVIFFVCVVTAYFLIPHRWRWLLLLCASCYFYAFFIPAYLLILFFLIAVDYTAGLAIARTQGRRRKLLLIGSIVANVGILGFFKYYNFALENIMAGLGLVGVSASLPLLALALPIGLSFHTFQSMSYTIEVYRGNQAPERHFGLYALYVMFFPQLVAGPIERPQHILHQFREPQMFDADRVISGLRLMLWGLFKKIVIADQLAVVVNQVYSAPARYEGPALVVATLFFAYQIYCDFSGYSDIAIGAARILGIKLMTNFSQPYTAQSIGEFWRKWHISLSTWFRDYLYIPLGGNRGHIARWQMNLLITFLVSGLWHGASWTFLIWGGLHGAYLMVTSLTANWQEKFRVLTRLDRHPRLAKAIAVALTFALVCFAWIFFRAATVQDAFYIAAHLARGWRSAGLALTQLDLLSLHTALTLAAVAVMEGVQYLERHGRLRELFFRQPTLLRWSAYYMLVGWILFFGQLDAQQFIYFQF